MDKKKMLIIGIIAVGAIGYYLYSRRKTGGTPSMDDGSGSATGGGDTTKSASAGGSNLTKQEAKKLCGRRPILAKKRAEWQKCIDAGGSSSFDADYGL